jgi:hypothetical protein
MTEKAKNSILSFEKILFLSISNGILNFHDYENDYENEKSFYSNMIIESNKKENSINQTYDKKKNQSDKYQ